jgi:excisionase family DNA binding protein
MSHWTSPRARTSIARMDPWSSERLLRPGQVAAVFQVSRRTISDWARAGKIGWIVTPGGHRRFMSSDVRALWESCSGGARRTVASRYRRSQRSEERTMCAECGCSTATAEPAGSVSKATLDALEPDALTSVDVNGTRVAIANLGGEFFAFHDECTHQQCALSDGEIEDGNVVCPCHFSAFDVRTGEVRNGPATEPVRTFGVKVEGDEVRIDVS